MEHTTFLMLLLSGVGLIAGTLLCIVKPNQELRLRAAICLAIAVHTFALSQIVVTGGNGYPEKWVLLLGLWPLLPAFVMHLILLRNGPPFKMAYKATKKLIYLPCFLIIGIGISSPGHFYEVAGDAGREWLIPNVGSFFFKLEMFWLVSLGIMSLYYMLNKKNSSSEFFSDVIVWWLPISFLLVARFTIPILPKNLEGMFWLPALIPVVGGLWSAMCFYRQCKKLDGNLSCTIADIIIQTDLQGRILRANRNSLQQLGCDAKEMKQHHISTLFPDLCINSSRHDTLTYMKKPNQQRIPVKIVVNPIPGKKGFLITGTSIH